MSGRLRMGEDTAPLSPNQEPIWFFDQLLDGDASFNMAHAYRLKGSVDAAALETALNQIVARHDSLRTTFAHSDGELTQRVRPQLRLRVAHVDVSGHSDPQASASAAVARTTNQAFDLETGPLLRAALIAISPDAHILALAIHHIVADGWSLGVLWNEFATRYTALVTGREAELAPLPIQYPQHAREQRKLAAASDESLNFWRDELTGAEPLTLTPDRTATPITSDAGGVSYRVLDNGLLAQIDQLARAARCTRFMVLTAAFQALMSLYSGQRDFCLGSQVAGRSDEDLEPMIGMFTHTVVLRADITDNPPFSQHLKRTRRAVLRAMTHPHIPYQQLVSELGTTRTPGRGAFFDVMFLTQEFAPRQLRLPDLEVTLANPQISLAKLDLIAEAWQTSEGLQLSFGYRSDLFTESFISQMTRHYATLLRAVVDNPDLRLDDVQALSPDDQQKLDRFGHGPATEPPLVRRAEVGGEADAPAEDATVLAMFEAQARRAGDQVAVRHGNQQLRYAALDARAEEVAAQLRSAGVRRGNVVAVRLARSVDMAAALLAVWKAGAAYLPLDGADERSQHMIKDSGAVLLLDHHPGAGGVELRLTPVADAVDTTPPHLAGAGSARRWDASDLAYVIYTSGSTGRPKGVAVSHGALAARVSWMRRTYGITPADQVLQFATLSFDTHAEELYPCLSAGATLVLPTEPDAHMLPDFLASTDADGLTVLDLPTPYWHELVHAGRLELPASLRLLILGADQVDAAAVARWQKLVADRPGTPIQVLNTYGPTEATVVSTCAQLLPEIGRSDAAPSEVDEAAGQPAGDGAAGRARPPIGRPAEQTSCHVVDHALRRAPSGVAGELTIGGAGLAWGYLGNPALTAERFTPDPYGHPGARLYRTGDLARWRADGQLEFLGRLDDQVKIRGYRVEPGEIEAVLLADPRVRQAAVVARDDEPGERRLVGYLVLDPTATEDAREQPTIEQSTEPHAEQAAIAGDIQSSLARRLPAYLRPSALVVLPALPLRPNGKLDRAALPRPHRRHLTSAGRVAPRSDAEAVVAEVWAGALGLDAVGAHDDFFALGGHSLLAATVTGRLSARFGLQIPLRNVFTERTVAGVAASIEQLLIAEIAELSEQEAQQLLSELDAVPTPAERDSGEAP